MSMLAWKLGIMRLTNRLGDSRTRLPMATQSDRTKESRRGGVKFLTRDQNEGSLDKKDTTW
jgi:hypothetical protein